MTEQVLNIFKTSEYDIFSFVKTNRQIRELYVKRLMKSIQECDMTMYNPIIVNSNFEIIDGQHRYTACKNLNYPIYYVQMNNCDSESAIILLNRMQSSWREAEFLHYNSEMIGGRWKDMYDFYKSCSLGVSNAVVIYPDKQINSGNVREGKIDFEKNKNADKIVDFIKSPEISMLRFSRTRPFVLAVRKAFDIYEDKQLLKIKKKAIYIKHSANFEQYLTAFENIVKK